MARTRSTFPLTPCPVLQAAGGAAGDDAEERDGQWCLPVSALRGDVGIPGQLLCILQRLQEGKPCSGLAIQPPRTGQLCHPVALHPSFQGQCVHTCVRVYIYVCIDIICSLARRP